MKVILGPLPCHTCGTPVTVVRRDVEQPCADCPNERMGHPHDVSWHEDKVHTHTIRDVGPFTTVDEDGTRHECGR